MIDGGAVGSSVWYPAIGTALGGTARGLLLASLTHMGQQFVAHADALVGDGAWTDALAGEVALRLVPASPMELLASRLVASWCTTYQAPTKSSPSIARIATQLRPVTDYAWLGRQDPNLWNWIEVKAPADATAEDVAASLLSTDDDALRTSFFAPLITAAPPYFALPPAWAERMPDAPPRPNTPAATAADPASTG